MHLKMSFEKNGLFRPQCDENCLAALPDLVPSSLVFPGTVHLRVPYPPGVPAVRGPIPVLSGLRGRPSWSHHRQSRQRQVSAAGTVWGMPNVLCWNHSADVIMTAMASQITGVPIVCSTVCSGADQRKHQRFVSLAFVGGIHRWPVDPPHTGPVTRKMFPFVDVIMNEAGRNCGELYLRVFVSSSNSMGISLYHCDHWSSEKFIINHWPWYPTKNVAY